MKRLRIFLIMLMVIFIVAACASEEDTRHTATVDGIEYVVQPEQNTISDGKYMYRYNISKSNTGNTIKIIYPDGSYYYYTNQKQGSITSGVGGWSEDYDENRYVDGQKLCDIVLDTMPEERSPMKPVFLIILVVLGIVSICFPDKMWYLEYGWRYKNAEASDLAIVFNRVGGLLYILIAIIWFFIK